MSKFTVRKNLLASTGRYLPPRKDFNDLTRFPQFFGVNIETRQLKYAPVVELEKEEKCQNTLISDTRSLSNSAFEEA